MIKAPFIVCTYSTIAHGLLKSAVTLVSSKVPSGALR